MAYFPDVAPGDPFRPDAQLSNAVRGMVNARNRSSAGGQQASSSDSLVIWNASSNQIEAFSAINFPEGETFLGEAVPAVPLFDETIPWGVSLGNIPPGGIGNCAVSGTVEVKCSGSGRMALPSPDSPHVFKLGEEGERVLYSGNGKAVLLLAGGGYSWNGPFALRYDAAAGEIAVSAGYLQRNGEFITVPETRLAPESGTICVSSRLEERQWTDPEIVFSEPDALHYPIGKCTLREYGSPPRVSVVLDSFHVTVAVILNTGACPLIQTRGA